MKQEKEEGWRERKMEILCRFSSLIFFFLYIYLMKEYLDVASTHAFILHVDYYILACCFFFFWF